MKTLKLHIDYLRNLTASWSIEAGDFVRGFNQNLVAIFTQPKLISG